MFEEVYEQLRDYQKKGVEIMLSRKHNLNYDDMGLGKTLTTLYVCLQRTQVVFEDKTFSSKILIVCPGKALYVWQDEIQRWFGLDSIIYHGTKSYRKQLMDARIECPIIITTYGMLNELLGVFKFHSVIADEIHEAGLLNHKTKTFKTFKNYARKAQHLYLLTGTPIRQGVKDCFAPLNLVNPDTFSSYWGFINNYAIITVTPFGKQIERNPRNVPEFRSMMNRYMIRRIKSEVLPDLPEKIRQVVPIQMTDKQSKMLKQLVSEFIYDTKDDELIVAQNAMIAMLRCRQLLVTPRLLDIDEDGAAFNYLRDEGSYLLESGRPFVVFTPFRQALPHINKLIKSMNESTEVFELCGGLTAEDFASRWKGFMEYPNNNKVLICVIKSGASFHATCASDCFFLGYEWDFNLNTQSEDRLCRIGQKNTVHCRYLLNKDSVDDHVRDVLNSKHYSSTLIVGTEEQYKIMQDLADKYKMPKKNNRTSI